MNPTVWVALIGGLATIAAATIPALMTQKLRKDTRETQRGLAEVSAKVDPVSNGFSRKVLESLERMESDLSDGRLEVIELHREFNKHLADHERAAIAAMKPRTPRPRAKRAN